MADEPKKPTSQTPPPAPTAPSTRIYKIIIGLLVVLSGVLIFILVQDNQQLKEDNAEVNTELKEVMAELDDNRVELQQKIQELEALGADVTELKELQAELEAEVEKYRKDGAYAWRQVYQLKDKQEALSELLVAKDREIAELKSLNEALYEETTQLKTERESLNDSISGLAETQAELSEKVAIASHLKAEGVQVLAINSRGRENESPFRQRQLKQLKVTFRIADNPVAPIGGRDIKLRIVEPNGQVIFDVATGSGTFFYQGREVFYTANQEILFDNSNQELVFVYDRPEDYAEGVHTVELYAEDYLIGKQTFEVK